MSTSSPFSRHLVKMLRRPGVLLGVVILLVSTVLAVFPQYLSPSDPNFIDYKAIRLPPSLSHPFGTDTLGRDCLSRVIWAYSINMQMAILATVFALVIGVIVGALVGYYRGIADLIFGRVVDAIITFPFLVLVIAIVAVLGPGLINMYIAITLVGWVYYARLMRAEIIAQMGNDYAAAGRVMGYSDRRIIFRHLLPNVSSVVLVYLTLTIPRVMLFEAFLSFLGLGVEAPDVSWGLLAKEGIEVLSPVQVYWWLVLFPSLALGATLLALNFLGDGIRDALDPRMKDR